MAQRLPSRPHLDHLRRQAKSLLAALTAGEPAAAATLIEFLPAAAGMTPDQVRKAGFRLADAQSAIARQTGFASWPRLARHVDQLRSLEGTWSFERLEIDGGPLPPAATAASRLLIDGDRFRTESPEATYEGVFNIDVEAEPHRIEINFVEGPEAGNRSRGIFRLQGDRLELCLDMNGNAAPAAFVTTKGSGHAYEILRRTSGSRPDAVTGGRGSASPGAPACGDPASAAARTGEAIAEAAGFDHEPSPTLARLQGAWTAEGLVLDGAALPSSMLRTARRTATGNEIKVHVGGRLVVHALVRIDERPRPMEIDYLLQSGPAKGSIQRGIMEWRGETACFCMSASGSPRPTDFTCEKGSGRTLSFWRQEK